VSTILDALKRHRTDDDPDRPPAHSNAESVLATLGYSRQRAGQRGVAVRTLVVYGLSAVAIGFVGLSALIFFLAPAERARPAATVAANRPAPIAPAGPTAEASGPTLRPPATVPPPAAAPRSTPVAPSSTTTRNIAPPADIVPPRVARTSEAPSDIPRRPSRPPVSSPAPAPTSPAASLQAVVVVPSAAPAPPNHFALALYNQRIGNYDEALSHYRALLAQGDSAEIHNNIGLISVEQGRPDEAVREYQRAIALDPKYVKAHNNLGVVYMRMNRGSDAASEFRVALSIEPRNVESIVNLALVQKATGRVAEARDLLRRAVAIDPGSAGSHYNLAVFADESGDRASAIEHYRAFLKYGSVTHAELVATVRARLAALAAAFGT